MSDSRVASLLFRITPDALGALPLTHVTEIMRPLPVVPPSDLDAGVLGLATIRGVSTPVIDAAVLLGRTGRPTRYVTLALGRRQVALAVDDVLGVAHLGRESQGMPAPLLEARLAAVARIDPDLPRVLLTLRLVPRDRWETMRAEAAVR